MRAILVSVDYSDLLRLTLPANRKHFTRVMVVTSSADAPNVEPIVCSAGAEMFVTDAFTEDGAVFNKFKALEQALDAYGRYGWLSVMDADVIWPGGLKIEETLDGQLQHEYRGRVLFQKVGQLCGPIRMMLDPLPVPLTIPPEEDWYRLNHHRNVAEIAGYSQLFNATDPALGKPPWHETNYSHAGAADSWFQMKWAPQNKVRPPWEVLHLGPAGANWRGRASPYVDGSVHPRSVERRREMMDMWRVRQERRSRGLDPFAPEKLH